MPIRARIAKSNMKKVAKKAASSPKRRQLEAQARDLFRNENQSTIAPGLEGLHDPVKTSKAQRTQRRAAGVKQSVRRRTAR